jgi:hypothetical protein
MGERGDRKKKWRGKDGNKMNESGVCDWGLGLRIDYVKIGIWGG